MNQERVSTSESPAVSQASGLTRSFGGLRSRYHAFLEKHEEPANPSKRARFGQGMLSFAIFSALFVAILTVFGIGLAWFGGGSQKSADAESNKPAITETSASALPAQPAGPAGHAEVRLQSAASKKTDGK